MSARPDTFRIAVREFGPFEQAIRAQWQAFEARRNTGLLLEAVPMNLRTLEDTLLHSDGMRDGTWDIGFIATDWIAAVEQQQAALDLAPMLAHHPPADYPAGWTASLLTLQTVGDTVLGIPYHDGPECLIYRRDLFEDAHLCAEYEARYGAKLNVPSTWSDLHQVARFLHRPDRGFSGIVFAAFPDGHNSVYDFLLQLWSRGGELVTATGEVCLETPAAIEALTFYRDLLTDASAVHPECATFDSVRAGMAFAAGQAAMMINWFGFATMAHMAEQSTVRSRVDVANVPSGAGGTPVSLNVYWLLSIAAGSLHSAVAREFLRHVMSPEMDKLTTLSGAIGCRRSTWCDREVNQAIPFYHRIEQLHDCARQIPRRPDWPRIAAVIDELVTATIASNAFIPDLLRNAAAKLADQPA